MDPTFYIRQIVQGMIKSNWFKCSISVTLLETAALIFLKTTEICLINHLYPAFLGFLLSDALWWKKFIENWFLAISDLLSDKSLCSVNFMQDLSPNSTERFVNVT